MVCFSTRPQNGPGRCAYWHSARQVSTVESGESEIDASLLTGETIRDAYADSHHEVGGFFAALRELRDQVRKEAIPNITMEELSMGMTGDFEAAIEEGATIVRIGTAIFGDRR